MPLHEELTFTSEIIEKTPVNLDDTPSKYTVVLGYHGSPADFPSSLKPVYESADIVLHEFMGWQEAQTTIMNDLSFAPSNRQLTILEAARPYYLNTPLAMKRLRLIMGTRAGQSFWDVPENHPEAVKIIAGRSQKDYDPADRRPFIHAMLRSDELALESVADRIRSVEPKSIKGSKRHVVVHAGMAHLLLYNALRQAAAQQGDDTELIIPFDHLEDKLHDQSPEVIESVAALQDRQLNEDEIQRNGLYVKIDTSGQVMKAPAHKYVKKIWQLVNQQMNAT